MCEYTYLTGWHVNAAPEWKQLLFSAYQKYRSILRTCGRYERPLCCKHEGLSQFVLTCIIELGSCQLCCCCCCCCCPPVPPTVGTLTESLPRQDCPAEVAADLLADGHTTSLRLPSRHASALLKEGVRLLCCCVRSQLAMSQTITG